MSQLATIRQHYIPQFYLKQFSYNKKILYQYDVVNNKAFPNPVSVESICFKKNLYEFKDNNGDIIEENFMEKWLSVYEREFAKTFQSIRAKASYKDNFHTLSFLSTEEKALLVFFMATLILRNPEILKAAQETALEVFGTNIDTTSAWNIGLKSCLPIYEKFDITKNTVLNSVMRFFDNLSFQICVSDNEAFFTSDNPIFINGKNQPIIINEIILPISERLALYMKPYERTKKGFKNRLVQMDKNDIEYFNSATIANCKKWLYSKQPFTKEQIKQIMKIRNERG